MGQNIVKMAIVNLVIFHPEYYRQWVFVVSFCGNGGQVRHRSLRNSGIPYVLVPVHCLYFYFYNPGFSSVILTSLPVGGLAHMFIPARNRWRHVACRHVRKAKIRFSQPTPTTS